MLTLISSVMLAEFSSTWRVFAKGHVSVLSSFGAELSQGGLEGRDMQTDPVDSDRARAHHKALVSCSSM